MFFTFPLTFLVFFSLKLFVLIISSEVSIVLGGNEWSCYLLHFATLQYKEDIRVLGNLLDIFLCFEKLH